MNQEQAIQILIQAVNIGQSKGAYTLQDAASIINAINALQTTQKQENTAGDEVQSPD